MNRHILTLLILPFLVLSWMEISGQPELTSAYHVGNIQTYGIDDGLPDRCIMSAFVDSLGKLNIVPCAHVQLGYEQNIYQIDGYRPLLNGILTESPEEPGALFYSGIGPGGVNYGVFLSFKGIKATGANAYFYNPVSGTVDIVRPEAPDGRSYDVWQVVRKDGDYYFLGHDGVDLSLMRYDDGNSTVIASVPPSDPGFAINRPLSMHLSDDALWFVLQDGLYRYVLDSQQLDYWKEVRLPTRLSPGQSIDFFRMPDGRVLIRDAFVGKVFMLNEQTNEIEEFDGLPAMFGETDSATERYVYSDLAGNLLFVQEGMTGEYIGALCSADGNWHDYSEIIGALTEQRVNQFFEYDFQGEDFRNRIYRTGYDLIVAEVSSYEGIRAQNSPPVRGMAELGVDSIHIMGNRLAIRNGDSLEIILNYTRCPSERVFDSEIHVGHDGSWWYSMDNGGITRRDPGTDNCEIYLADRDINRIAIESDSTFIFATAKTEIFRWNYLKNSATRIDSGSTEGFVNYIHVDHAGNIWLATSTGLFVCEWEAEEAQVRKINLPVEHAAVLTMLDDGRGNLWLGTFAKGLIIYEISSGKSTLLREESGLSNNTVASLVRDDAGVIWAGTFRGITLLDEMEVIGHVYQKDGLIDNDCNRWSVLKTSDGKLYFGTPYGVSAIEPEIVKASVMRRKAPTIFLSLIQTNDTTFVEGSAAIHNSIKAGIQLPASGRNLRIAYGLSDYSAPGKAKFAYRVGDGAWNYIGNVHDLDLIDLPKGDYDLHIKGADERGQWSSNEIIIPIRAEAFFYEQWWFYLLCSLVVIFLAIAWQFRQRQEKKRLELEVAARTSTIREQADALRELDRVKSKLYTNITHEFRTPLTVIDGLADRAVSDPKAPGIIKRNVRNLLNLVNQMLDLRKLESGNLTINAVQTDVMNYIRYVGESFGSVAHSKGIEIGYKFDPDEFVMDFDPEKFERILSNLISNAIKFTPTGGNIEIRALGREDFMEVAVADNGVGIEAGDIDKIFHRYYQADSEQTRMGQGTGIGLTLVSELLQLLGGSIRVESKPGEGSVFTFSLPVSRIAPITDTPFRDKGLDSAATVPASMADLDEYISSQTEDDKDLILLVEDNPDVLRYVAGCLKDDFYLDYATNGEEGIDKAIDVMPSIIISDVMMPGKTGYELCDTLKQDIRTSHIPIILLTAKADLESKLEGLKFGADDYLQKPFHREELELRIANLIANRKKIQQRYASFDTFPPAEDPVTKQEDAFILAFRKLVEDNIDVEQFGITELCEAMHLGKSQLHKKIKTLTGKSPIQYIRSVKLNKARSMLLSGANVSEVAYDLGFSDPKYFTRVFKSEFGQSPSDFMKAGRSGV